MTILQRRTWRNHTGNQACQPLRICRPTTVEQVAALVREAEADGATVRAVGSGHSWSDCALTGGFLVETDGLAGVRELPPEQVRAGIDTGHLVAVGAGIRLRELNTELDRRGLGLANMGGYDAQTVAGVISTSTHGSGISLGPLAEAVRSLDLVTGGGRLLRIEPADGPTDRAAFVAAQPGWTLEQDDHVFNAAVVSMGCFGIVVAAILQVVDRYCLREVRRLTTWESVREDLRDGAVLRAHRHYEVYLNPYARLGRHRAVVCTRDPAPCDGGEDRRSPVNELLSRLPLTPKLGNLLLDTVPGAAPAMLDWILRSLRDREYTNVSHKVLNIGAANLLPAYSAEIGVPVDGRHVEAIDRVLEVADRQRRLGSVYATAPVALRFVRSSDAYLSMMHGRDTMMIELILMTDTEGGYELLAAYESALYALGGRPHWGQVNSLTPELVCQMYPRFDDWQDVRGRLDPRGTFDGPFPRRVGISAPSYVP